LRCCQLGLFRNVVTAVSGSLRWSLTCSMPFFSTDSQNADHAVIVRVYLCIKDSLLKSKKPQPQFQATPFSAYCSTVGA
jgi:hypothetical protein